MCLHDLVFYNQNFPRLVLDIVHGETLNQIPSAELESQNNSSGSGPPKEKSMLRLDHIFKLSHGHIIFLFLRLFVY